ncbi:MULTISPECIES: amino acid ABC transporter permease [Staphylococcus]|jgi:putative amino-acid transport system permease protein|uniref:Amino acid ABC transporter permease n=1 Tax=Staphylococcus shinii TaxID=2912228 RepID=A0A418IFQ9_9STAP|nr:amino acid ABC transporter permease [Staphylococcus shinii]MDW8563773.1 amino acid ABC transporter permease [Staphylococcus shinii]MDW8567013.1 amino acid ABC transporter permease [Staphylococcus shinii]MDW8569947.1 amino acid ABC transporter permease [Staphylococcus shinii]MDW8574150.1 amino acid ABC transporter permease [Staphylococcus shinii]MEC5301828.1 amino acid ABC transporter permease [Staphylococcus shinii]
MAFDPIYFLESFPKILPFLPTTIYLAIVSLIISIVGGLVLAIILKANIPVLKQLALLYISFFRSIPSLVQLFLIYYGLPQLIPDMKVIDALTAAIIGLSVKNSAYLAEIFRAAIASVDKGQFEAAHSIGLNKVRTYFSIILPQATKNAIPATGNIFVGLIKETSLVFTLGVTEIFAKSKLLSSESYKFLETFLAVAIIYWIITILFSYLQNLLEKRINKPYEN